MAKKKNIKKLKCTKCGRELSVNSNFYNHNGYKYEGIQYLPICKDCLKEIFKKHYLLVFEDEKYALYKFCERVLDMPFYNVVYDGAKKRQKNTGWMLHSAYVTQINSFKGVNSYGNCFEDGEILEIDNPFEKKDNKKSKKENSKNIKEDVNPHLIRKWGEGFTHKEYMFLEDELKEWKKTHKCDNQAEITLLKEICITVLDIRNSRDNSGSTKQLRKDLQDLMKTASVDPAKANSISDGQTVDRFGVWIKDIEQKKPAEWHEEQDKYMDMDGFKPYIKNYIVRPIKNFFTGSKDFLVDGEDLSFKKDDD